MLFLKIISALAVLAYQALSQTSLEKLVDDLEKRVTILENRLAEMQGRSQTASSSQTQQEPSAKRRNTAYRPGPISVSLLEKKTNEIILSGGNVQRQVTFTIMFTNGLSKDLSAFSGDLVLVDKKGYELISFEMDIELRIGSGKQASWKGSVDLDSRNQAHGMLSTIDSRDCIPYFTLKKAIYTDGTYEVFTEK